MKKDSWLNKHWRPAMAWTYLVICIADFIVFPVAWSILQAYLTSKVALVWSPLTLQGAGLFHLAMGGILGVSAYGRSQEKINGCYDDYRNYNTDINVTTVSTNIQPKVSPRVSGVK